MSTDVKVFSLHVNVYFTEQNLIHMGVSHLTEF